MSPLRAFNNPAADLTPLPPPIGFSEIFGLVSFVASLLTVTFGHDFGVGDNAQNLATLAVALVPIGIALSRAIKHRGTDAATAVITAARISAVGSAAASATPPTPLHTAAITDLTFVLTSLADQLEHHYNVATAAGAPADSPFKHDAPPADVPAAPTDFDHLGLYDIPVESDLVPSVANTLTPDELLGHPLVEPPVATPAYSAGGVVTADVIVEPVATPVPGDGPRVQALVAPEDPQPASVVINGVVYYPKASSAGG